MATISVESLGTDRYRVRVADGASSTVHEVTADDETVTRLAPGVAAEEVVAASFRFLLDREPKESILSSFALPVISRYFPEYESRLDEYLIDRA